MSNAEESPDSPVHSAVPQYPIESVDNALKLLWLVGSRSPVRLTDATQYLDVASSTAHRLLAMLQYRGFVRQDPATRAYETGPEMDRIAFNVLRRLDVRQRARPILERLNAETGETVHLGRLEGQMIHFIDSLESSQAVRVGSRLGRSLPAHATSTGKAALAILPRAQLEALYPIERLQKVTSRSIGTRTELFTALADIRRLGFATSLQESEDQVSSVAMALDPVVNPPIAVNVSVPVSRMTAARRKQIVKRLAVAVEDINGLMR